MTITYSKRAIKFLLKQPHRIRERIVNAIEKLPNGDVIKLQGEAGYRLRVGDFRVLFDRNGNIISILAIDNRGQVYK